MKLALAALAALALTPVTALAQSNPAEAPSEASAAQNGPAAASLPNSFDRPAAARAPSPESAPVATTPERVAAAQAALRAAIVAIQAGTPDYDAMTPGVATRLRDNASTLIPLVQGFGDLQAGLHAGSQEGAELFAVTFDRAATEWVIGLNDQGKIAILLFRPVDLSALPAAPAD